MILKLKFLNQILMFFGRQNPRDFILNTSPTILCEGCIKGAKPL